MPQAGAEVGRFVLRAPLGQGAQASVWRAHDPQLDRDVALKLFHEGAEDELGSDWRDEARLTGGLQHPGIVSVHDLLEQDGRPVIVSECVPGQTLAERLRAGALPAPEAVRVLREVLDALAHAHAHGVVHRDLKPSNIMIEPDGRARVMDFGIAARVSDAHDGRIVGSPGTISPEAAAGAAPSPAMDLFAAGMVLGEALLGRSLRAVAGPTQALQHALHAQVVWPEDASTDIDDTLRGIVLKATAREPARRWPDAVAMRDALDAWLHPRSGADAAGHATLAFLLRRMRLNGDFPALSDAVLRIQQLTSSDRESVHTLSAEILRDVALTHRLLRVVNSARFHHAAQGEVSTVSRAVALVGFGAIRSMALSLLLLEHMGNQAHAGRMKGLFLESLLSAALVDQLTPPSREREEAFLAGMFSHLGRLLVTYYLPEEAQRLQGLEGPAAERAQIDVLGISCAELGQGVAASWGLPESLRRSMCPPAGEPPQRRAAPEESMRWRVRAAAEVVQQLMAGAADTPEALHGVAVRFGPVLGLGREALTEAVQAARGLLAELAASLGLDAGPKVRASRLLQAAPAAVAEPPELAATVREAPPAARAQQLLAAGLADVTSTLAADTVELHAVLRMILETLWRALGADQVALALKDPRSGMLQGRLALGEDAEGLTARLRVDLREGAPADLFAMVCRKGADTLIDDAGAARLQASLPAWFKAQPARSFVLLPLLQKGQPVGLIYIARRQTAIALDEAELSLLRSLRNQAVLAFRATGASGPA